MKVLSFVLACLIALPALAQPPGRGKGQEQGGAQPQGWSHEDRRKLREDVDSARGAYGRQDRHRQDRMAPEERERLRRDVQDANRQMKKR